MFRETENFGLRGGTLKVPEVSLARLLTEESLRDGEYRKWWGVLAYLYVELGLDEAEFHANWGV